MNVVTSTNYINNLCSTWKACADIVKVMDTIDFTPFLIEGRDIIDLINTVTRNYASWFKKEHKLSLVDILTIEDYANYFVSRYDVNFKPYTSYVVTKNYGNKIQKRDINA